MLKLLLHIFILTGVLLIVFVAAEYFRSRTDYRTGWLHRIGSFLLYGYVKVCSAIEYGLEYLKRKTVSVFRMYHPADGPLSGTVQKDMRLHSLGSSCCQSTRQFELGIRNRYS